MKEIGSYRDPLSPVSLTIDNQMVSDEAYKECVQKTVIACTDAVFIVHGEPAIYLGKRAIFPMKGVWCFGGRILFNDQTPSDSVSRCIATETGLKINPGRFRLVMINHYAWIKTAQGDFPGKNLALTYVCEVTKEELAKMPQGLSATEYDTEFGIQKFTRHRLVKERVHRAMLDVFDALFSR